MSNIIGLGLDATEVHRIADTMIHYGDRFLNRVFTVDEIAYCRRRPRTHAERQRQVDASLASGRIEDEELSGEREDRPRLPLV